MKLTASGLIYSRWRKQSGAELDPSVTITASIVVADA